MRKLTAYSYCGLVVTIITVLLVYIIIIVILTEYHFSTNTSIQLNFIDAKHIATNLNGSVTKKMVGNNITNVKKKRKYHVPKFMLELYETRGLNYTRADIVRSLVPKHAGPYSTNNILEDTSSNHLLIFDLPASGDDEDFLSAELRILTLVETDSEALTGVKRSLKLFVYDDVSKKLLHQQESYIYHVNNTWLSFNLTEPVIEILNTTNEVKYLKILITITTSLEYRSPNNNLTLSLLPVEDNFEHDYPILLLSYISNKEYGPADLSPVVSVRKKRSIEDDYEEETNKLWDNEAERRIQQKRLKRLRNSCKRRSLYIDFAEIQYDEWIVQPSGYEAYQCQGRCFYPVAEHLDPTKHAIIQALLHSVAPSKVSRSCCVPTKLTSISILYVDEKGVLTYRYAYKDMVVVECGCRDFEGAIRRGSHAPMNSRKGNDSNFVLTTNPFLNFIKEYNRRFPKNKDEMQTERLRRCGEIWRSMTESQRRPYREMAERAKKKQRKTTRKSLYRRKSNARYEYKRRGNRFRDW